MAWEIKTEWYGRSARQKTGYCQGSVKEVEGHSVYASLYLDGDCLIHMPVDSMETGIALLDKHMREKAECAA